MFDDAWQMENSELTEYIARRNKWPVTYYVIADIILSMPTKSVVVGDNCWIVVSNISLKSSIEIKTISSIGAVYINYLLASFKYLCERWKTQYAIV